MWDEDCAGKRAFIPQSICFSTAFPQLSTDSIFAVAGQHPDFVVVWVTRNGEAGTEHKKGQSLRIGLRGQVSSPPLSGGKVATPYLLMGRGVSGRNGWVQI